MHTSTEPLSRRVRFYHLDLRHNRLKGTWYADALVFKVNSIIGNTVANLYTQVKFVNIYPITARRELGQSQIDFADDAGLPETLLTDGYDEFTGRNTEFF